MPEKEQRPKRARIIGPDDVLLSMRKEDVAGVRAHDPELAIEWSSSQRAWFYTPSDPTTPFPAVLLPFLPHAAEDNITRTYLEFRGGPEEAALLKLRWDPFVKCWWHPGGSDLLPSSLLAFRPTPFSWAAWCEQRVNPSATLCQTAPNTAPIPAEAQKLADEMLRASLYSQRGFLYLRPADPERSYVTWLAIRQMNATHATTVVIVSTPADIPLWRSILQFLGTQPASVVLLSYRELHLLDPRHPREQEGSSRILPATCTAVYPEVVVWDHCHQLRGQFRRYDAIAATVAGRAAWNVWLSENPCASPDELSLLDPLLESRDFGKTAPSAEKWISWRAPSAHKAVSTQLQRKLFDRNHRGCLGAVRSTMESEPSPRVIVRPIPSLLSAKTATVGASPRSEVSEPDIATCKATSVAELIRLTLGEQRTVVVVCSTDAQIALLVDEIGAGKGVGVLDGNQISPRELPSWILAFRCSIIHEIHVSPGPPLRHVDGFRVIFSMEIPASADQFRGLVSLTGPRCTIVIPYVQCADELARVQRLPIAGGHLNWGTPEPLVVDRY